MKRRGRGDAARAADIDTEFRFWNKLDALRLLVKHLGMLDRTVTVVGDPSTPLPAKVEVGASIPSHAAVIACLKDLGLPLPDGCG